MNLLRLAIACLAAAFGACGARTALDEPPLLASGGQGGSDAGGARAAS